MLLQTNSYIVPKEKKAEHSRLIRRFRQTLLRLGCDHFEVYEQVGSNWSNSESQGRYVQILRFLDRKHQLAVQAAERSDPTAQAVIADFCELINFPYQQQQGLFAVGFYTSVLPVAPKRGARGELVSTVEHEVISDPEAEMPYPGASDGPPLDEAVADEAAVSQAMPEEELDAEPAGEAQPIETEAAEVAEVAGEPVAEDGVAVAGPAEHSDAGGEVAGVIEDEEFAPRKLAGVEDEYPLEPLEAAAEPNAAAGYIHLLNEEPLEEEPAEILGRIEPAVEAEPEPLQELEPEEELLPEPEAEPEAELEPVSELEEEVPHALPANAHGEEDFMNLMTGEITDEDEDRAHGFIEGELVDDLENEQLDALSPHSQNGEELTGHEVQPVPKHKSKNAPSPW